MDKNFKSSELNKVLNIKFNTEEERVEFEEQIEKLLKRKSGRILYKSEDLMDFSYHSYKEMFREKKANTLTTLAMEALTYVENHKGELFEGDICGVEVDYDEDETPVYDFKLLESVGSFFSTQSKKKEPLLKYAEEISLDEKLLDLLHYNESSCETKRVFVQDLKKETIDLGLKANINNKTSFFESFLLDIYEWIKVKSDLEVECTKSMLRPKPSMVDNRDFDSLKIPEESMLITFYGKPKGNKKEFHNHILIRFERDFEKVTIWHDKEVDFSIEKELIREFVKNNFKKMVLKDKFKE